MSNEELIFQHLQDALKGKVFNNQAPVQVEPPYVIFTVVSEVSDDVMMGESYDEIIIQVDAYSLDKKQSNSVIRDCLTTLKPLCPFDIHRDYSKEFDTNLYRANMECTIAR